MSNRIVLLNRHLVELRRLVFDQPEVEGAAFILCGEMRSEHCRKLISHAVCPIAPEDYLRREKLGLTISSQALTRIAKLANFEGLSIIFAHSHPGGLSDFSRQDDLEEAKLIPFLQVRVPNRMHGTLVLTADTVKGRIYCPHREPAHLIFALGDQFLIWEDADSGAVANVFDRQVRAFGASIQKVLSKLHVGIVGLGGTGSPVAEQLHRLGVGKLTLFDGDVFEPTNVNRVFGSTMHDEDTPKVDIAKAHLDRIDMDGEVEAIPEHITYERAALRLRECDVVFGCTDKQLPRAILTQLSLKYCVPVFDLGVIVVSEQGRIQGVHARVTTVMPGESCLFCRGRISPEVIRIEALSVEERASQAREGYAPELDEPAPAVIAFTSAIASLSVSEFLHRLTGYMGVNRKSSEVLVAFSESKIRTNRVEPRPTCFCVDESTWGRGDEVPYLGLMWPSHTR